MKDIKNNRISKFLILVMLFYFLSASTVLANADYDTFDTLEEVSHRVLQSIYNREPTVKVRYQGSIDNIMEELEQMLEEIYNSDDYIRYSIHSLEYGYSGYIGDVVLTFSFQYWTNQEQENFVDRKVKEILSEIIKPGMSMDDRQKAIHDYIVTNVAYDESLKRYSAYDALVDGKATCQGYAMLAYKMLKEAGIENRIVQGRAGGENHAWNLVNIRGNWYHMDVTWDDPVPDVDGRVMYKYYNLTDEQMKKDHYWDFEIYPDSTTQYAYESSYSADYQSYEEFPFIGEIPSNKEFTVTFSKGVDINSAREKIVLLDIATGEEIPCEINSENEYSKIKIKPLVLLTRGKEYILVIHDGIKSLDGDKLEQGVVCRAFVSNN